jgi:hypothetical protein
MRTMVAVGLLLSLSDAASATTVTYLDTTGDYASLAIGADGLGLVAYRDAANGDLKIAHCSNIACTAATISTLDSAGDVGLVTRPTPPAPPRRRRWRSRASADPTWRSGRAGSPGSSTRRTRERSC